MDERTRHEQIRTAAAARRADALQLLQQRPAIIGMEERLTLPLLWLDDVDQLCVDTADQGAWRLTAAETVLRSVTGTLQRLQKQVA